MKKQEQANIITSDLMSLKLDLVQKYGLTYIQSCEVIQHIKDEMTMNEEADECDWLEEMIDLKKKGVNNELV